MAVLLTVWLAVASDVPAADSLALRWVYLQQNLQVTENLPKIEAILRRSKAAGFNGIVLADYKLNILDRVPTHYFRNAKRLSELCNELELEIIPAVAPFGYSAGILAHDANLAEGLPVRDQPMVVRDGRAVLESAGVNLVPGDFEQRQGNAFAGWNFQDEPGRGTFADDVVHHGGRTSLRIENPPDSHGNRRVSKLVRVRPWTLYRGSVWIRTVDFEAAGQARMFAMSPNGRVLSYTNLGVQRNQDWKQHQVIFNSLDNSEVRFYVGVWDCRQGRLWFDDLQLAEEAFVNLVRRPGCPFKVTDEQGQTAYEEGRDLVELRDEHLGTKPWAGEFDVDHEPPVLRLATSSRIREAQKLRASYYHAVTIYDGQVPCSLSEPKVFEVVEDQVLRVQELFHPRTYFLSHDEIRVAGWSADQRASGRSAGQLLAENVRRCAAIVRKVNPDARLCIWSDMFDPYHNAVNQFYLVNGDLAGAWEGLPPDAIVVNWNRGKEAKSLAFFAQRGHPQVLAGYYDGPSEGIRAWLDTAHPAGSVRGAMYTTWQNNFADLEKFAAAAWGR